MLLRMLLRSGQVAWLRSRYVFMRRKPNDPSVKLPPATLARPRCLGFTLVELLVVISVIGVLIALLLPAVQSAREAARRCHCQNNLRQLALALQTYESDQRAFPVGCAGCRAAVAQPRFASWIVPLLPYLELGTLHDSLQPELPMWGPHNLEVGASVVPQLLCPSTAIQATSSTATMWRDRAFTDYGGLYGVEGPGHDSQDPGSKQTLAAPFLGVMLYETPTRIHEIIDGTSQTAVVAEMLVRRQSGECEWANGHHLFAQEKQTPVNTASGLGNDLGSPHQHGAWSAFCDGHVQWLSEGLDQLTLNALLTKAGQETVVQHD